MALQSSKTRYRISSVESRLHAALQTEYGVSDKKKRSVGETKRRTFCSLSRVELASDAGPINSKTLPKVRLRRLWI